MGLIKVNKKRNKELQNILQTKMIIVPENGLNCTAKITASASLFCLSLSVNNTDCVGYKLMLASTAHYWKSKNLDYSFHHLFMKSYY